MGTETELRLRSRSLPLPLHIDQVIVATTLDRDDIGQENYRLMTEDEMEWISFLYSNAKILLSKYRTPLLTLEKVSSINDVYNYKYQYACAFLLRERCNALMRREIRNIKHTDESANTYARIAELETENQCIKAQLEEANRHVDEVEKRAANAEQFVSCRDIDGHGLCSLVIRMRQEGKTDEEIAEFLDSSGRSLSQIGALLHTDPEATQAAQMKLAQRLLGKA